MTPLERPKQWEGKERLTDDDIRDLQKFAAQIVDNDGDAAENLTFQFRFTNKLADNNRGQRLDIAGSQVAIALKAEAAITRAASRVSIAASVMSARAAAFFTRMRRA